MIHALFALGHMQDIVGAFAPAAFLLYAAALLPAVSVPARMRREVVALAILVTYLIVNLFLNRSLAGASPASFFRHQGRVFYVLALFAFFLSVKPGHRLEERLYPAALYVGAGIAALSLFSYFVVTISIGSVRLSSETRLLGAMGGHNPTSGSLGMLLVMVAASLREPEQPPLRFRQRPSLWWAAGLIFAAMGAAKSRGYLLALFAALAVLFLPSLRSLFLRLRISVRRLAVGLLFLAVVAAGAFSLRSRIGPDILRDPNVTTRLALFARAASMGLESPLTGLGIGTFEQTDVEVDRIVPGVFAVRRSGRYLDEKVPFSVEGGLHAHNVYLQMFAETGLVGLILLGALLVAVLRRGSEVLRKAPLLLASPETSRACFNARLALGLVVFLAVAGMSAGYSFLSPGTSWLLWVAMARLVRQRYAVLGKEGEIRKWATMPLARAEAS